MADGNSFAFYRKGEWLTKGRVGYADIAEGIASSEFYNTVAIQNDQPAQRDESDWRTDLWRRGSQWNYVNDGNPALLAHSAAPAYAYALGDATNLYNSTSEGMTDVVHASRSILWLKPDHIVVYDRAETKTAGRFKRWWLQLPRPATVSGKRATMQTATGQQLFVTALLPANATLTAVNTNEQHIEDTAAGNDPMKVRLRVDAPGNPQAVRFLHVLQGADAGAAADAATAIKSEDGAFEGAVVRGTAVLFPVNVGAAVTQLAYVAPAGVTRHLITGLTPGAAYTAQTAAVAGGVRVTVQPGGSAAGRQRRGAGDRRRRRHQRRWRFCRWWDAERPRSRMNAQGARLTEVVLPSWVSRLARYCCGSCDSVSMRRQRWHRIPGAAFQQPSGAFFANAAPLLEEKGDVGELAVISHLNHPLLLKWPRAWPRLAADNHPVNSAQVQAGQGAEQRLQRQELDLRAGLYQVGDSMHIVLRLDADTHPDVIRPFYLGAEFQQALGAFGEHLERVPRCAAHDRECLLDELDRHIAVEQVAHRVDEDDLGLFPTQRRFQGVLMQGEREAVSIVGLPHGLESPRHAFGVAVLAPGLILVQPVRGFQVDSVHSMLRYLVPMGITLAQKMSSLNDKLSPEVPPAERPKSRRLDDSDHVCSLEDIRALLWCLLDRSLAQLMPLVDRFMASV